MTKHTFDSSQIPNVTWKTLDDLYRNGDPDCVALYLKYCYHANIQGTNQVYANLSFMTGRDKNGDKIKGGLDWGRDKTRRVRTKLVELGYIDLLPQENTGEHGEWGKSYTKINHLVSHKKMEAVVLESSIAVPVTEMADSGNNPHKYLNDNKNKSFKDDDFLKKEEIKGENTYVGRKDYTARPPRWEYDSQDMSSISIPLTYGLSPQEETYVYNKVIEIDPIFEEKWELEDEGILETQRLKVIQNYEAHSSRPKTRQAFLARIIEYTANGGVNKLFEEW